ncbi:MAG: hypothetical protein H7X97_05750 [Opitutaceae bacterium]|nr:hypothetical protein [Verrucomicrobiales bacterium]
MIACLLWLLGFPLLAVAAEPLAVQIDFAKTNGAIRALHGVNKGPLGPGGLLDLTAEHRALGIPLTRLHDCYWPNPYVVDIHAVFPDFKADPARPESFDFRLTDEYIAAVRATGAQIVYRLGESIEHTSIKRFAHPPKDVEKWASICLGIIRHYNEGWAGGFHHDIQYWEIWNEPENRPAMWSGTDEDYFRLYRVTATAIKHAFPKLKVGGPSVGASGRFVAGVFQTTEFVENFLRLCRDSALPLDFFSWHCYTADPNELVLRAKALRRLLDENGFTRAESHLNEWNYLPGNTWAPGSRQSPAPVRQRYFEDMAGSPGAAFVASALIEMQDAPLDAANLFHGEIGSFGLFNEFGVPRKNYFALRAFHQIVNTPRRVAVTGGIPGKLSVAAGLHSEGQKATVLISNFAESGSDVRLALSHLPWNGDTLTELRLVDANHDLGFVQAWTNTLQDAPLPIRLPGMSVALLQLRPAKSATPNTLTITSPANRLVFQRDRAGKAVIPIAGTTSLSGAPVEARLIPVGHPEKAGAWHHVALTQRDGDFRGSLPAQSGWFELEVRATTPAGGMAQARVNRVGVGEVFVVVGHSVAQGGDINLPGSTDDRVNTVALDPDLRDLQRAYERTGDPEFLPALVGSPFTNGVMAAPFGHGTYFWARFGELVAQRENVPVLIFNAAFGGTSLDHWAKSARGQAFEHSFVKSSLRMPYINLLNTLRRYVAVTGVRAVLADQGQNDANEPDTNVISNHYRTWVDQARQDLGYPDLAVVINRQTPYLERRAVRQAQEQLIRDVSQCFAGPDYDLLRAEDRLDRIHLSTAGAEHAALLWAEALSDGFFGKSLPYQPR